MKVIIGGEQAYVGGSGPPNDDNEGEDDGGSRCDDGINDQVPEDTPGGPHTPRRPRGGHGSMGP